MVDTESRAWQGFSAGFPRSSPGIGESDSVVTRVIPGIARSGGQNVQKWTRCHGLDKMSRRIKGVY